MKSQFVWRTRNNERNENRRTIKDYQLPTRVRYHAYLPIIRTHNNRNIKKKIITYLTVQKIINYL